MSEDNIKGLHHITAIAGNAQRNLDFYTQVLGLRLIKRTVNFDDPTTYHFYFADRIGTPGNILTFFPWDNIGRGKIGTGMPTHIGYAVPEGSLAFWKDRFANNNIIHQDVNTKFGEEYLSFEDPDGLLIELIIPSVTDNRKGWETPEITNDVSLKGFHSITLTLDNITATAGILTEVFGYTLVKQEANRFRFMTDSIDNANMVDLLEIPHLAPGHTAAGTNHHVAFRVKDEDVLMRYRDKIASRGLYITPKINRDYFFSLYFREPGGVLFELATENPGFTIDESIGDLGMHLMLPKQYEPSRKEIEDALPTITLSTSNNP